jgi:Fic family protein
MAYIHVKRIGDKKYYTLRISVRKEGEVITKDLCNLGNDLSKIKIEELEKKYHKEIRKSYSTIKKFLDSNYYFEKAGKKKLRKDSYFNRKQMVGTEAILLHYNSKFLGLHELTQNEFMEGFIINFAVNSTSIEGNTITLKEAERLFREDIIPKDKTLREVHDLTNTKETIESLNRKKPRISLEMIEAVHDKLLENIDKRRGYRNHDIRILGQPFKPSPARYVKQDMRLLLKWYEENKKKIHPLALISFFHHKFENIHPFSDGNGRTGRVLMNYILSTLNYPPFLISMRFRKEYLDSMSRADNSLKKGLNRIDLEHYRQLLDFLHSQFRISYWDNFLV